MQKSDEIKNIPYFLPVVYHRHVSQRNGGIYKNISKCLQNESSIGIDDYTEVHFYTPAAVFSVG